LLQRLKEPTDMPAAGDFETWELLGRNAYGAVYRGVQFSLKRDVAIFELDAPLRKEAEQSPRFWDEVTQIAQLTDDALVPVFAVDRKLGWIVMELMAGHCGQLLDKPQPIDVARSVLRQGLSGLRRLHEAQRTHGDLRPQTLLIHRGGRIKLSFALGAAMAGGLPYHRREMKYVAPELVSPALGEFGPRADLYCLAFSVLELLLGPRFAQRFPGVSVDNDADTRTAWMRWHADEAAKLPSVREMVPGISEEFATVMDKLLHKRAADRYASAAEALTALSEAPLVPVFAPGAAAEAAAGGAMLIGDVDKLHDPASRYEGSSPDGSLVDEPGRPGGSTSPRKKQVAAPGKAAIGKGAAGKGAAGKGAPGKDASGAKEKLKKNIGPILVGLGFACAVGWIVISDGSSSSTPADGKPTDAAAAVVAPVPPVVPVENVEIPEHKIWNAKVKQLEIPGAVGAVRYRLVGKTPEGLDMDVDGTTLWLPTEEQAPAQYRVEYEALDESDPPKTARGIVVIDVTEVNSIPAIELPTDQKAPIGQPFQTTIKAVDPDLPPNEIRFRLGSAPPDATIDPATGVLSWTPSASTTPGVVEFEILAEDDGRPPETGRGVLQVFVPAKNRPPTIEAVAEQTVTLPIDAELRIPVVSLRVRAVDPDDLGALPRFALVEPTLPGAAVDARTGEFTLTPPSADSWKAGIYPVTVEVFDQAVPPESSKITFQIVVKPATP